MCALFYAMFLTVEPPYVLVYREAEKKSIQLFYSHNMYVWYENRGPRNDLWETSCFSVPQSE